jgi:four helix bundle protein
MPENLAFKSKSEVGKRAYAFSLRVLKLCDFLPNKKSVWIISDQLLRASMSIGANIAEGQGSSTRKEFRRFYQISYRSLIETRYWLLLLLDGKIVSQKNIELLINELDEISRMLTKAILSLKKKTK